MDSPRAMSSAGGIPKLPIASRLGEGALLGLMWVMPLMLGGAPAWSLWPLVGLSFGALLAAVVTAGAWKKAVGVPLPAILLLLSAAFSLIQLVPLPPSLLELMSAPASEVREFALAPLGLEGPRPISLEPSATWRELAKHLAYAAACIASAQLSGSRRIRRHLAGGLALSGLCIASIGLGHLLANQTALFGVFKFQYAAPPLLTTFGNPNHLAAFLTLTGTTALGLALAADSRRAQLAWGSCYLVIGVAVLLSLSRGGIFFFIVGQLLLALVSQLRAASAVGKLVPIVALAGVLAVGGYIAWERLVQEAETASSVEKLRESKISSWPMMLGAARAFSVAGMGRGAFESAFSRHQTEQPDRTFTHPENLLFQLWSEQGLIPAVILLLGFGWALFALFRRHANSALDLALLIGLVAVALHDIFDFSLELPPTACCAAVALGIVGRVGNRGGEPPAPHWQISCPARRSLAVIGAVGVLAITGLVSGRHVRSEDKQSLRGMVEKGVALAEIERAALEAIDRYPADYWLYYLLGTLHAGEAKGADGLRALAYLNRALFLRPVSIESHQAAARALLSMRRRAQAFLEYRLAYEAGGGESVIQEAVSRAQTLEEIQRALPHAPLPLEIAADNLWRQGRRDETVAFLRWACEVTAGQAGAARLWILAADLQLKLGNPADALALARRAADLDSRGPESTLRVASALARMNRRPEAVEALENALQGSPGHWELTVALAENLRELGEAARAHEVLEKHSGLVKSTAERIQLLAFEGHLYRHEGRNGKALRLYRNAMLLSGGTDPYLHFWAAEALEALGRPSEALIEVREGIRILGKPDARLVEWTRRLEERTRDVEASRASDEESDVSLSP